MIEQLLLGGGFAFAAAVQPGPLQAFLLARTLAAGWRRTLPAALAPLLSDAPIALLALLAVNRLPAAVLHALRAAGGLLLLYLARAAWRQARALPADAGTQSASGSRTLLQAALVNLLNPNPYLGWTLVLGPAAIDAWRRAPARAVALIAAFYGVMTLAQAALIVLAGSARRRSPRTRQRLVAASALLLALLGLGQIAIAAARLAAS